VDANRADYNEESDAEMTMLLAGVMQMFLQNFNLMSDRSHLPQKNERGKDGLHWQMKK
jgi:hypothetical protein